MKLNWMITKQNLLIENAKLKEENERLKKLVFDNNNEKELFEYSMLLLLEDAVERFEKTEDSELKEAQLDELIKLSKIFSHIK